jgi:hypothetical protein
MTVNEDSSLDHLTTYDIIRMVDHYITLIQKGRFSQKEYKMLALLHQERMKRSMPTYPGPSPDVTLIYCPYIPLMLTGKTWTE